MLVGLEGQSSDEFLRAEGPKSQPEMDVGNARACCWTRKVVEDLSLAPAQHVRYHLAALTWLCASVILPSVARIMEAEIDCVSSWQGCRGYPREAPKGKASSDGGSPALPTPNPQAPGTLPHPSVSNIEKRSLGRDRTTLTPAPLCQLILCSGIEGRCHIRQ